MLTPPVAKNLEVCLAFLFAQTRDLNVKVEVFECASCPHPLLLLSS
jgi:hypothetical protein